MKCQELSRFNEWDMMVEKDYDSTCLPMGYSSWNPYTPFNWTELYLGMPILVLFFLWNDKSYPDSMNGMWLWCLQRTMIQPVSQWAVPVEIHTPPVEVATLVQHWEHRFQMESSINHNFALSMWEVQIMSCTNVVLDF